MSRRKKTVVPNAVKDEEWRPIYDMIKSPPRPLIIPAEVARAVSQGARMAVIDPYDVAAELFARLKAFTIRGIIPVTALSPDAIRVEFKETLASLK